MCIRPAFAVMLLLATIPFTTIANDEASDRQTMSESAQTLAPTSTWHQDAEDRFKKTWNEGRVEAFIPLLTVHMPYAYSSEQRAQYNEFPAGFGLGLGRYNDSGNYEGMFAMGFKDSHRDMQYVAGYLWIPTWTIEDTDVKVGAGLAGFITARADIGPYAPIPAILPVASLSYKNLSLQATYVPGGSGNGNVLFGWGKWSFE